MPQPNPTFSTYSFQDFNVSINGPGGNFTIGGPADASAEEGCTLAMTEETNTQTIGADGSVMNSLHASMAGTFTSRLLKTSPVNYLLSKLYNYQRLSSAYWGANTITVRDVWRGDHFTLLGAAFVRFPQVAYAKVGGIIEWEFHIAVMHPLIGTDAAIYDIDGNPMTAQAEVNYQNVTVS